MLVCDIRGKPCNGSNMQDLNICAWLEFGGGLHGWSIEQAWLYGLTIGGGLPGWNTKGTPCWLEYALTLIIAALSVLFDPCKQFTICLCGYAAILNVISTTNIIFCNFGYDSNRHCAV